MILRITSAAIKELEEAHDWYDERVPGLGRKLALAFEAAIDLIEAHPRRYPRVPEIRRREVHRYRLDGFPYIVGYEVLADRIMVLAFAHTSRRPTYWHRRKP